RLELDLASMMPRRSEFLHNHEVFAVDLDLGPRPLAEEHPVARLDVQRADAAILGMGTGTSCDHLAFHRLLLGGVRDDDATRRLLLFFDTADQDPVLQWTELHRSISLHHDSAVRR